MVDFAMDKLHPNQGRGFAYVEFETADEAENAMKHMDGGKRRNSYRRHSVYLNVILMCNSASI
jgi:RNA recognition motif-containing protein